jgi:hypothetical protein
MKRISLVILLCAWLGADAWAQCNVAAKFDRGGVWAQGTHVAVWVSPDLSLGNSSIQTALYNWARSDAAAMMGVTLSLTTDPNSANVRVYMGEVPGYPGAAGGWSGDANDGSGVVSGHMFIHPDRRASGLAIGQTFAHELGHPFGLMDCSMSMNCGARTTVMNVPSSMSDTSRGTLGPTSCDEAKIAQAWGPEFSGSDDPCIEYCRLGITTGDGDGCYCRPDEPLKDDTCENCSPVIVDVDSDGIDLTSAAAGVDFALDPAVVSRLAWTRAGDDDAWLALDRDCNGSIDDGSELFGNFTTQPVSGAPNGYLALTVFDANGDRVLDAADAIFEQLRLWTDRNHDGRSSADELIALATAGVEAIELEYRTSGKRDPHGNLFRYRAKVKKDGRERWSYDVFLTKVP